MKQTSVALGVEEIKIVKTFAAENGLNFSAALRMVIRRWAVSEDQRFRNTAKGKQALDEIKNNNGG